MARGSAAYLGTDLPQQARYAPARGSIPLTFQPPGVDRGESVIPPSPYMIGQEGPLPSPTGVTEEFAPSTPPTGPLGMGPQGDNPAIPPEEAQAALQTLWSWLQANGLADEDMASQTLGDVMDFVANAPGLSHVPPIPQGVLDAAGVVGGDAGVVPPNSEFDSSVVYKPDRSLGVQGY